MEISWTEVAGATGYNVYRREVTGGYKRVAGIAGVFNTSYVDKMAVSGTEYYYAVKAFNTSQQSALGEAYIEYSSSLATPKVSIQSTETGVEISWTEIAGATGYNVYRREVTGGYKRVAGIAGVSNTSYVDKMVVSGTEYYYAVKAFNTSQQSEFEEKLFVF